MLTQPTGLFAQGFSFPTSAAATRAACGGYGIWSAAYLFQEAAGDAAAAFGSAGDLLANGAPAYRQAGLASIPGNFAVGLAGSEAGRFTVPAVLANIGALDDFAVLKVTRVDGGTCWNDYNHNGGVGLFYFFEKPDGSLNFVFQNGSGPNVNTGAHADVASGYRVALYVGTERGSGGPGVDQGQGVILSAAASYATGILDTTGIIVGGGGGGLLTSDVGLGTDYSQIAALYVAIGQGAALDMAVNAPAIALSFARHIGLRLT